MVSEPMLAFWRNEDGRVSVYQILRFDYFPRNGSLSPKLVLAVSDTGREIIKGDGAVTITLDGRPMLGIVIETGHQTWWNNNGITMKPYIPGHSFKEGVTDVYSAG